MADQNTFLSKLKKNLYILEERQAKYGGNAPLELLNQIDDHKMAIAMTKQAIAGEMSDIEWREALKPLLLAVSDGQVVNIEADTYIAGDVEGDVVSGDKIGRDKITFGDVEDATLAAGERSAAATKGGIAISGDVGGDLTIFVGSTHFAIPFIIQIVIGAIVVIGIVFLVGFQGFNLIQEALPKPMPKGQFNVAMAEFQVTGQGEEDAIQAAQELTDILANTIEGKMDELVIYSPKIEVRLLRDIELIKAEDAEARAEAAEQLAKEINADVVIYGVIEVDGRSAIITPTFYIDGSDFDGAAEITGENRMGEAMQIRQIDNKRRQSEATTQLKDRFRALTLVISGLSDFVAGEYADADSKFKEALEVEAWKNPDVIHVLRGNAALKQNNLDEAEKHYLTAMDSSKGEYSRAYAGLGSVYYLQALGGEETASYDNIDLTLLDQAIATYERATDPTLEQPRMADVSTKASFGLGQAYLVKAITEFGAGDSAAGQRDLSQSIDASQQVINDYGDGDNERVKELAAHAYARLGLIDRYASEWELALEKYSKALELLPDEPRFDLERARYQAAMGDIYLNLDPLQPDEAIRWYEQAVDTAPPDSNEKNRYQAKLDELKQ